MYQTSEKIENLFDNWVYPLCETVLEAPKKYKKARKEEGEEKTQQLKYKDMAKLIEMEHKKAYRILEEIFKSDKDSCKEFVTNNNKKIMKLLMRSLNKAADSSKGARLR